MAISIQLFFRNIRVGFSIHRAFAPLLPLLQAEAQVTVTEVPCSTASPLSLLRNLWWAFRHRERGAICHITGDTHYLLFALPFHRKVITVHDLVTLRLGGPLPLRWLRRRLWFSWSLPLADRIVCISEKTREELLREFPSLRRERVTVIHDAVDPIFQPSAKAFDAAHPRILHVGTNWNKNVERTLEALQGIPCTLVIVGKLTEAQTALLHTYGITYENPISLNDKEMRAQYEACDIVSFPSLFEGFGMPIIEGQAVGRPILTSSIAPLTEVAGEGACYVVPEETESIRQGFLRLIGDEEYREALVRAGFENVKRFSAERIAQEYLTLYTEIR